MLNAAKLSPLRYLFILHRGVIWYKYTGVGFARTMFGTGSGWQTINNCLTASKIKYRLMACGFPPVQIPHWLMQKNKGNPFGLPLFLLVAGVGFEPHDLRVMSPTSYQAAPSRDIRCLYIIPKIISFVNYF